MHCTISVIRSILTYFNEVGTRAAHYFDYFMTYGNVDACNYFWKPFKYECVHVCDKIIMVLSRVNRVTITLITWFCTYTLMCSQGYVINYETMFS